MRYFSSDIRHNQTITSYVISVQTELRTASAVHRLLYLLLLSRPRTPADCAKLLVAVCLYVY